MLGLLSYHTFYPFHIAWFLIEDVSKSACVFIRQMALGFLSRAAYTEGVLPGQLGAWCIHAFAIGFAGINFPTIWIDSVVIYLSINKRE
jgi:hypothetical protein